jgi:hypothetical protein
MAYLGGNHGYVSGLGTALLAFLYACSAESVRFTVFHLPWRIVHPLEFGVLSGQSSIARRWRSYGTGYK